MTGREEVRESWREDESQHLVFSNCQFVSLFNSFDYASRHHANVRTFYYNVIAIPSPRYVRT